MNDQVVGFDAIDPERSTEAFRELSGGKVVTRELFDTVRNDLVENRIYTTLFRHRDHFTTMFRYLGYELVLNDHRHFFFLREADKDDDKDYNRTDFKIHVVLLIIGRYFAHTGRDLQYLELPSVGLGEDDLKAISANDEYRMMLRSADFKDGVIPAINFLKKRGFVFEVGVSRYTLSPAGMHFLELLVESYQSSAESEVLL